MASLAPIDELRRRFAECLSREDFDTFERLRKASPWKGVDCWVWPGVVTEREWTTVCDFFEELTPRVLQSGLRLLANGEADRWLPDEPYVFKAIADDPGHHSPQVLWRYDFIWDRKAERIDVLEVQAGDPSGLGWVDARAADYEKMTAWHQLKELYPLSYTNLSESLCEGFRTLTNRETPKVLFLAAPDSTVKGDIEELAKQCSLRGLETAVCSPSALTSESLAPFDAVYRDTYEEIYFPPNERTAEILARATQSKSVALVNPLRSNLWDAKALFSLVEGVLPTRRLSDCEFEELSRQQSGWVLKPNFHYGGFGITLGPHTEQQAWGSALVTAFQDPENWVVQQYSEPRSERFPILTSEGIEWQSRYATWSAWVVMGRVAGLYLRVSHQAITNVHQGGALMPVFVLGAHLSTHSSSGL